MRGLSALGLLMVGCHLIGGAGDLTFVDDPTPAGGSGQGGSGASGGAGGASCEATCTGICEACDVPGMEGTCAPTLAGSDCDDGVCDGTAVCVNGRPTWSRVFGDDLDSVAEDIAVSGDEVVIVGRYDADGGTGFGLDNEPLDSSLNNGDAFTGKVSRSDGAAIWALSIGDNIDPQQLRTVALDANGDIVVAGSFLGQISHSGWATVTCSNDGGTPYESIFVGKLAPDGSGIWSYTTIPNQTTTDATVLDVAVGPDGTIAVGGRLGMAVGGGVSFGNGYGATAFFQSVVGFVLLLEPDAGAPQAGEVRWALDVETESPHDSDVPAVAFDDTGNLWAVGSYAGESLALQLPDAGTTRQWGFLAQFGTVDEVPLYARTLGNDLTSMVTPTALTAVADGLVVAGTFEDTLDLLGGHVATAEGDADVFIAELALDGSTRWLRPIVATAPVTVRDVAVDSAGHIAVSGSFSGSLDFGDGYTLESGGLPGAFVFKLDATGTYLWSQRPGGNGAAMVAGLAFDADRQLLLAGTATSEVPPGADPHGGADDILVMLLAP